MHVRPGHAQDRRRRSDPEWFDRPALRLRALGQTAIEGRAAGPADGRWLAQRPGQLLKYLVSQRDRIVHAEQIAETLWPGTRRGLSNVRFTVHALRKRLEPERANNAQDSLIVAVAGGYVLDRRRISIDADEFDAAVHAGVAEFTKGDERRGREHLEAAVALYRGDLFADERYAEWAQPERERLRELLGRALRLLALLDRRSGALSAAQDHLERLVQLEPFDEDVVRDLLSVLHEQGRRTRAARFYEAFRIRMHETFGEFPGFDLEDVAPAVAPSQPS